MINTLGIHLILFIKNCLNNPLSLLRFSLPVLFGKKLYEGYDYHFYTAFDPTYSLSKTWFLDVLPNSVFTLDHSQFIIIKSLILVSTLCAVIGLLGRVNLLILAFLGFFIFGLGEGYGLYDHHMSLPTQVMFALAFVPGTMKISIDNLFISFFRKTKSKNKVPNWGVQLILLLVVLTYFAAGVSKLRYGNGINWLDGATLSFYLKERSDIHKNGNVQLLIGDKKLKQENKWKDEYGFIGHTYGNYQTIKKWNDIADYIANNKPLVIALSIGSLLFELLGFIVFINSKYRNIYLISAIIFHMSIGQLMGISFRQYRLICFCLLDWNSIIKYGLNHVNKFNFVKTLNLKLSK